MPFVCAHKYFKHFLSKSLDFLISVKNRQNRTAILPFFDDKVGRSSRALNKNRRALNEKTAEP